MTLTIDMLIQIERESLGAPATMLRMRMAELRAGLAFAPAEVRDYAGALLLKLEHRLRCESVAEAEAPEAPVYFGPWVGMAESEQAAA
jgi:hypothetical protein